MPPLPPVVPSLGDLLRQLVELLMEEPEANPRQRDLQIADIRHATDQLAKALDRPVIVHSNRHPTPTHD